jgi:hypothetical protein
MVLIVRVLQFITTLMLLLFLTEGRQGLINWRRLLVNPVADDSDGWEKFGI